MNASRLKHQIIAAVAVVSLIGTALAEVPLPLGYTVLEWIESTGHQRLNTKWKASATLRCELDFAPLQTSGSIMFGSGAGQATEVYRFFNYSGTSGAKGYIFDCGSTPSGNSLRVQHTSALATDGTRYLLKLGIDDQNKVYATTCNPTTGAVIYDPAHQSVGPSALFAGDVNVFGGMFGGKWSTAVNEKMRLYGLKMFDVKSGETERSLVRDFVPCRNEEGVAGLWDKVEGRFYTNCVEGGLRFVGSDDKVARAEWIKSTGSQLINTGVNASGSLEAEMDFASHAHTGDITIGTDKDDSKDWRFFDYSGGVLFDCGSVRAGDSTKNPLTTGKRYFAQFGVADGTVYNRVYEKGSATPYADYTAEFAGSVAADPVYAFGGYAYQSTSKKVTLTYAKMTLYSLKLKESGEIVRDYVPCYTADRQYGLMDLENGNAVNLGTGVFEGDSSIFELEGANDATLVLREGPLTAELAANRTLVAKASPYEADFSGVTSYPALELRQGTLSVQDGAATAYTVTGTLTVAGGARLKIDLTSEGCDRFTAGALDLSGLSASAPLFVVVKKPENLTALAAEYVIASGAVAADGATDGVIARGDIPARFEVRSGDLVMIPLLDVPVTATWKGDAACALTEPTCWEYANAVGQVISKPGFLPTAGTKVVFPSGCAFNWTKGTSFAHGEIVFPATLGGDCDWTGLDVPINATIDLNGHTLGLLNLDGKGTLRDTTGTADRPAGTVEIDKGEGESLVPEVDTVRFAGAVKLVLSGAGVKNVQDTAIADATDVEVLGGKVVVVHGDFMETTSNGGILHIAPGAVFDCNLPGVQGGTSPDVYTDFNRNEPTHGKTIVLEGTLLNTSAGVRGANALLSHLVVREGGTIGGVESVHRIDLRVLKNSANARLRIEGGTTLTARPGDLLICCDGTDYALDRIDNYGWVQFEGAQSGTITNNVHCYDGSTFGYWSAVSGLEGLVWVIEAGTVDLSHDARTQAGHEIAIKTGATVNLAGTGLLTWNGRLSGNGAIRGSTFVFGGAESCWAMKADDTGFTEKVNIDGLTRTDVLRGLSRIELTKICAEPLPAQMALGPAGALTSFEAGNIKVQVCDAQGVTCAIGWVTVEDVAGVPTAMLNVRDGVPVLTATWTGAGDAANLADTANWVCSNESGVVERALPKATTVVTIQAGKAFNVPRTTPLAVKEIRFAGALVGDTDLSGLTGALMDVIDLDGHRLTLSGEPDQPTEYAVFVNGNLLGDGGFDLTSVYSGEYGYFNQTASAGTNDFWWGTRTGVAKNPGTFAHESYSVQTVAFIQIDGTLYQKVTVPETGDYVLSYFAAERQAQSRGHTCKVLIDDAEDPVATTRVTGATWTNVAVTVRLEAGEHTLTFQGVCDFDSNGKAIDSTTTLDNVSLTRADLPAGEIVIDAAEGVAGLAKFRICDDIAVTKAGAGMVAMDDEIIRATTNLTVASGTVKIAHANLNIRSVGGTITVASEGTLDCGLDAASNIHSSFGWNEPTHGKTIVLAGTLQNVAQGTGANALVGHLVVKEGARIGGSTAGAEDVRIDVRTLANSWGTQALVEGGATLTALPGNHLILSEKAVCQLDRIDNYGWVQLESTMAGGTVTNGVHCYDGSTFGYWSGGGSTDMDDLAWVIETGTVEFVHDDRYALTQTGNSIEIKTGATLHSVGTKLVSWNGRLSGNGSVSGSNFALGGDQSCWAMKADDTGFTEKVDYSAENANFLTGLKTVEVVYAGDKTTARRFVIGPAGNLTQAQADVIALSVTDADGEAVSGCRLYVNAEGMLELNVAMTTVEKAAYTGLGADPNNLSDPANWSCTTADLPVEGGLPMSMTEITIPSDRVFNCTNVDQVAFASVVFPASIPGDSDWRGLGTAPISATIDLQGHKLYVSELKGTGTITDTTALGENLIQDGSFENVNITDNSGAWGAFQSPCWTAAGGSGVSKVDPSGSRTNNKWPWSDKAVDGEKVAYVKQGGQFYQTVMIPEDGNYVLTYSYASRYDGRSSQKKQFGSHKLLIQVDEEASTRGRTDSGNNFAVNKVILRLAAGEHKIVFQGVLEKDNKGNPVDTTTVLDDVSLRKIPAAGELHVVVADGRTAEWTTLHLEGALKFVKEGAGTYLASNMNGTGVKTWYLGDTWVREGCYKVHQSSHATTPGRNVEYGFYQVQQLGAQGSETTVEEGAIFDGGGNYDGFCYTIVLNGGTFGNLGTISAIKTYGVPSRFRLTDDSLAQMDSDGQLDETDLGGHTLTITTDSARSLYLRGAVRNGTLVSHGGRFWPCGEMSDVDLVLDSKMSCNDLTVTFRNLTMTYTGDGFGHGGNFFCVRGTYTPVSDQIWRFKLLDGATIDLSKRTTPLDIQPDANGLFFDENAKTIYVSAAGRRLRSSEPLLTWTTKPSVKFVATQDSDCGLIAKDKGLYPLTGMIIIFR